MVLTIFFSLLFSHSVLKSCKNLGEKMSNQTITLIYTDAINNNNKFYTLVLNGDTVTATWGK